MSRRFTTWYQMVTGTWTPPPWASAGISDVPALRFLARLVLTGCITGISAIVTLFAWAGTRDGVLLQVSQWLARLTIMIGVVLWIVLIRRLVLKRRGRGGR